MLNLGILEQDLVKKPYMEFLGEGVQEAVAKLRFKKHFEKVKMTLKELKGEKRRLKENMKEKFLMKNNSRSDFEK